MTRCRWIVALLPLVLMGTGRAESAPETQGAATLTETIRSCTAARDRGQTLKVDGHWLEARTALEGCAIDACPMALRSECRAWLEQLSSLIPSVVFVIEGQSPGAPAAKVYVDGESDPNQAYSSEVPIELEPGVHEFRIDLSPHPAQTTTLTLNEGEQHRLVRVRITASDSDKTAANGSAHQEPAPGAASANARVHAVPPEPEPPTPWLSYGLGLGAIVGLASATGLYIEAHSDLAEARRSCSPRCPSEQRENIDNLLVIADVVAVTSVLLGAAAVYFFPDTPDPTQDRTPPAAEAAALGVALAPGSLDVWLRQSF